MNNHFFPYGAQYYRTPNPPEADWERDLREMKAQGMNTVKLWAMWSWIHQPDDTFDFSHLDKLMSLCESVGLKALIQVILENAPAWLARANPEATYIANDGQRIQPMGRPNTPGGGWPGLCLDNPAPASSADKFMTALASRFAGHPALLGYDVWNEVWFELDGYIGAQTYCYCDGTIDRFMRYLRDKYGDIDGLNGAWRRRYSCWEEVTPPRHWGGYPDWIDWIKFRLANQGELLRRRVRTLRAADPNALLVSHGLPTTLGSMANHLTDDWRNAREVDIYGLSCFPHWFHYDNIETLKVHDMIRGACAGKRFWTAETQAGASGEGLAHSKSPSPEDIRLWNWISLATGGTGLLYWQWRPELLGPESPGFGLCNLDGSPSERTQAASRCADLISKHPELADHRPARGQIAIAVLPESQIFCHISERNAGKYAQAVRGVYRAYTQAGYQVDFAKMDQLSGYSMVYLPFPLMIERETATMLTDYVETGGCLVAEVCPALFGDNGMAQAIAPGHGLGEVFGVRVESGPETIHDNSPVIDWRGDGITCAFHRQSIVPMGADVLAEYRDGGPAVTRHQYGEGRAVLIGTYAGISFEWGCADAARMLADIANEFGVNPPVRASDPDVIIRLHECERGRLCYMVNLSPEPKDVTLTFSDTIHESVDAMTGTPVACNHNTITMRIHGYDARVLSLVCEDARLSIAHS